MGSCGIKGHVPSTFHASVASGIGERRRLERLRRRISYHPTNTLVKTTVTGNFHLLQNDPDTADCGTYPCGRTRCNLRSHQCIIPYNTPGRLISIELKYTCTSNNVVYIIKLRGCHKAYIRETSRRLGNRFREHLRSTRVPNTE